jgi:hypothetical protein
VVVDDSSGAFAPLYVLDFDDDCATGGRERPAHGAPNGPNAGSMWRDEARDGAQFDERRS